MRQIHAASSSRLALAALQDPDGCVETLLELARNQDGARRRTAIDLGANRLAGSPPQRQAAEKSNKILYAEGAERREPGVLDREAASSMPQARTKFAAIATLPMPAIMHVGSGDAQGLGIDRSGRLRRNVCGSRRPRHWREALVRRRRGINASTRRSQRSPRGRPDKRSVFLGRNITQQLIILLSSTSKRRGDRIGFSREIPLFREFPCYVI
jgi:hypothetical protein